MQMTASFLYLMIFPRMRLHCKLDPVQYRQYEYGSFKLGSTELQ